MSDLISEIVGKEAFDQVERLTEMLVKATLKLEDFIKTGKKAADDMNGAKGFQQTAENADKAADEINKTTKALGEHKVAAEAVTAILKDYSGTIEQNVKQSITFKLQLEKLKEEKKALDKQFANKELDGYKQGLADIAKAEQQVKVANAELTQTLKAQIKEVHAVEGSYDQLNQRLVQLRNLYRQLGEEDRNGEVGSTLLGEISQLDAKLKTIDATIGNFQRNVGNYASGFSNFSDAFKILQSELDATRTKINQLSGAEAQNAEILKQLQKEEALLSRLVDDQIVGFASATQELKKNEQALQSLAAAGLQNTEFYNELLQQTAELKDNVGDLKNEIKNLASDTSTIDGLVEGAQGLAGGFAIAEGAAALFGAENEDLQKSMQKLQAIMAIMMGLQQIQNVLQKDSSLMLLLNSARTKALAAAQAVYTYATGGATAATNMFRTALIGTGLGALLVLLATAASAMTTFGESTKGSNVEIKNQTEALKELQDEYDKMFDRDKRLFELGKLQGFERKDNIEELKRQLSLEEASGKNQAKIFGLKQKIIDQEIFTLENKKQGYENEGIAGIALYEIENDILNKKNERAKLQIENDKRVTEEAKKNREKQTKEAEDAAKKSKELQDRNLKARLEVIKTESEAGAEGWKTIADNEERSYDERMEALANYALEKENIIRATADYEVLSGNKTKDELYAIEVKRAADIEALNRETASNSLALLKKQSDEETQYRIAALEYIALNAQSQEQEEINTLTQKLEQKKITVGRYESEVASIKDRYAKSSLDNTIAYLQEEIDSERVTGEEKIELQKRIDAARIQSAELANQKILDKARATAEAYKQITNSLVEGFVNVMNAGYDRRIQQSDKAIQNINKEKDAEINKINQIANSEDEARKQKAATEAKYNAMVQREEARKRSEQRRQAAFNKSADIAKIMTATALAVITAWTEGDAYTKFIRAAAAGVAGAAQLASAIATPLPQYYKGVKSSPETWAWVGERGTEGRINPDGSFELTPNKPTLTYLKKGTEIIPHERLMQMAIDYSTNNTQTSTSSDFNSFKRMFKQANDESTNKIVNAIKGKDNTNVNVRITSNASWNDYIYNYYKK